MKLRKISLFYSRIYADVGGRSLKSVLLCRVVVFLALKFVLTVHNLKYSRAEQGRFCRFGFSAMLLESRFYKSTDSKSQFSETASVQNQKQMREMPVMN